MASLMKYGSQGDDVKDLQNKLNANGYGLSVDGVFGKNTLSAVKDYQQKNGLTVDGIVGTNTMSALLDNASGSGAKSGYTPTAAPEINTTTWDESEKGSAASEAYQAAKDALAQHGDFVFSENEWLNSLKDSIKNYGDFSYDVNSDALYQQYADQYMRQGKLASADVMGQAAAMTGGFGNSYAATVGNQAYQSYLQQLNDRVPELYQLALERYNMDKQDLYDQYGMLLSEYEREYGEHSDEYNKLLGALGIASDDYYKGADMYLTEQDISNTNAWEQAKWEETLKQYANEEAWREKEWKLARENHELQMAQSGAKYDSKTGKVVVDPAVLDNTPGVTDDIRTKAASFESNEKLAAYIDGLEASKTISPEEADALYAEFVDTNESKKNDEGKYVSKSYSDMVKSTSGWSVIDDGGINWGWGVDRDAILKAPNGEQIRLSEFIDVLVGEGMKKSDAKYYIKQLQKNLGV